MNTSAIVSTGWEGILDADEQILWQGRPDAGFFVTPGMIGVGVFSIFFTGFALFWMLMAAQGGGFFWMFGLLHFSVGAGLLIGTLFGPSFIRKRTFYTLTQRRAFVAKDLPMVGRSLKSYPINAETVIDFKDGDLPSIMFATEQKGSGSDRQAYPVGFERIAEGRDVLKLMRGIQRGDK